MSNQDKDQELPGIRLISTSPERIFLQIGDDIDLLCLPFPENHEDVTWCAESAVMTEVEYMRLDIHLEIARRITSSSDRHYRCRIAELEAEVERLKADRDRIDWLADPGNHAGNVSLPVAIVEKNLSSLRAAIDEAMKVFA